MIRKKELYNRSESTTDGEEGGSKKKGALPPLAVAGQALDVLERQLPGGGRGLAELAADLARRRVADSRLRSIRLGPDGA